MKSQFSHKQPIKFLEFLHSICLFIHQYIKINCKKTLSCIFRNLQLSRNFRSSCSSQFLWRKRKIHAEADNRRIGIGSLRRMSYTRKQNNKAYFSRSGGWRRLDVSNCQICWERTGSKWNKVCGGASCTRLGCSWKENRKRIRILRKGHGELRGQFLAHIRNIWSNDSCCCPANLDIGRKVDDLFLSFFLF